MGREARLNKQYRNRGQEPPWIAVHKQKRQAKGSFDQYRLENLDKKYLDSLSADERQAYLGQLERS
jgi:hypothetical protein